MILLIVPILMVKTLMSTPLRGMGHVAPRPVAIGQLGSRAAAKPELLLVFFN